MTADGSIPLLLGLPLIVFLLLANATFVATEFALVTVRRTRINQLAAEGNRPAQRVQSALGNLDYYIAAAQLGITMASIALGFVGEPILARIIEPPVEALVGAFAPAVAHTLAITVAFIFVTSLHIIIGEFIPKTIALEEAERTSLLISLPLAIFVRIFGPVIWAMNKTGNFLLGLLGMEIHPLGDSPLSGEDLALTVETSASAGLISRRELSLTRHLLNLSRLESRELMIPRSKIVAIRSDASWDEVAAILAERPLTRYPVYRDDIDDIVGILDAKRLLLAEDERVRHAWSDLLQDAVMIPESVKASITLETMRKRKSRLVILVDEYGGTAGLVTQFDIVRFLAEDLPDDGDTENRHAIQWDGTSPVSINGLMPLSEVVEAFGIDIIDSDSATLGGFITERRRNIPSVDDEVVHDGIAFRVVEMDQYRVARVEARRAPDSQTRPASNDVRGRGR
jgi:CBS domain containing-hemolysin-like protein